MNFKEELDKLGLTTEQYEACLKDIRDKTNGLNDLDWEEIKQKYNLPIASDSLRKANSKPFGGAFVSEYMKNKNISDSDYMMQLAEIRKERQKLYDARAAFNKDVREHGRWETDLQYFIQKVETTKYSPTLSYYNDEIESDNDMLICLTDLHYGMSAESNFGKYDSKIAWERMGDYVKEIIKIQTIHKSENAYVFLGGDLINGNIHFTTQLQNRENVVEQVQGAAELISVFIFELSKYFKTVYVNGVSGNHSRIGKKDDVLRNERMDDLIPWYIQAKLSDIKNVKFCRENYDDTIASFNIRGKEYLGVHGDYDQFSESGVSKLVMMLGFKPEAIIYGHLHKCSYDDVSNIRIVRSGTFAGTVDDYTISKRLTGKPSQMVCIINDKGIRSMYPVSLK